MGWYKQHSSFSENPFNKPIIDRCINCGSHKEVKTTMTAVSIGWCLGGTVGIGTLLFAFGVGPAVALGLFIVGKFFN